MIGQPLSLGNLEGKFGALEVIQIAVGTGLSGFSMLVSSGVPGPARSGHRHQSTFAATASTSIFSSGRASPLMTRSVAPGL